MDIFEILKKDHRTVLDLLDKLESTSDRAGKTRQKQLELLKQELLPHMFAEENYFYQYLLDRTSDKEEREKILEGFEEHRAARSVLADVESVSFTDERWQPDIKVLKEVVKHHIDEEEREIFEIAEDIIEDTNEAAQEFESMKKETKVKAKV